MVLWESGYVEANGLTLHYRRSGRDSGFPPLVTAHGISDDGGCWIPIAEEFVAQFDVILADARGHGRSEEPQDNDYGPIAQGNDILGLIAALGLRRPFILGHSMGAVTTLAAAGTAADIPAAIMVEDPPPRLLGTEAATPINPDDFASMRAWLKQMKRMTRDELLDFGKKRSPTWPDTEFPHWADAKAHMSPNVQTLLDPANRKPVNWPPLLRAISCPALLITADPELGAIMTPEAAATLKQLVPHLTVTHVPGAGHNIRREQPALYLEAVRAFLADLPASSRP
jgi:pimeloyl-ACP methyl ester carboxylesterase